MKHYCQTFLCAVIMMIACSVGYGHASPPKTNSVFFATASFPAIHNDVINIAPVTDVSQMNIAVYENEYIYSSAKISAEAIHSKAAILPAPKVTQLSLFIHYNVITNQSIKKIEPRARSSDILNQNKRC